MGLHDDYTNPATFTADLPPGPPATWTAAYGPAWYTYRLSTYAPAVVTLSNNPENHATDATD